MYQLLIISIATIGLASCGANKPHCDAYGSIDKKVDTEMLWALPSAEVVCTLTQESDNNQPQPEVPASANDFAYIREDKELTGSSREA